MLSLEFVSSEYEYVFILKRLKNIRFLYSVDNLLLAGTNVKEIENTKNY